MVAYLGKKERPKARDIQGKESRTAAREKGIIRAKYKRLMAAMDERMRRLWAGSEAISYGWGGVTLVSEATGLSYVRKGRLEP